MKTPQHRDFAAWFVMVTLAAGGTGCAGTVSAAGRLELGEDPASGERQFALVDLESGGVRLGGWAMADHAGTLIDIDGTHDVARWQGATEVGIVAAGEVVTVPVVERDIDAERDPLTMVTHYERVSVMIQDPEVAWLVSRAHAAGRIELQIANDVVVISGRPFQTLVEFLTTAVDAHAGREGMPPLVIPSER